MMRSASLDTRPREYDPDVRRCVFVCFVACAAPRTRDVTPAPTPHDAGVVTTSSNIEVIPAPPEDSTVASGNVGTWREGGPAPTSPTRPLAVHDEPAPGRSDSDGHIGGYCPPRGRVFDLGGDRALVTREPCSGVTEISIRERAGDRVRERRVADSLLLGVVGQWQIVPLERDRVVMISQGSVTNLQLVDLAATRARWIRMPPELERARGLNVSVAGDKIYVWGGSLEIAVGQSGCGNPRPREAGCDPVAVVKHVPNPKVWVWTR